MTYPIRRTAGLALVSAIARLPAFLIPVLIASVFGAGPETDAYFLAYSAVLFLGGTIAQGTEQAIVPFAAREISRADGAPRRYLDFAARRAAQVGGVAWVVGIPLLTLAAAGHLRMAVVRYALLFTPLAIAWCAAAVFAGALVSQWRIALATGSMLWRGAGAMVGLGAAQLGGGLSAVAAGLGLGEVGRAWWMRRRLGSEIIDSTAGSPASLHDLGRAAFAQATASAAIGVTPVVERLLAVSLGAGAVSHLEYAVRLLIVPAVLFDGALAPLLLVRWTRHITREGTAPLSRDVLRSVGRGMALAAGLAALVVLFAPFFVSLLLEHGRFGSADAMVVVSVLRVLAIGFVATMGALLLERLFLASARNRVLAALSVGRAALRLSAVVTLLPSRGILAFGFGYVIADWAYLLALIVLLRTPAIVGATPVRSGLEET